MKFFILVFFPFWLHFCKFFEEDWDFFFFFFFFHEKKLFFRRRRKSFPEFGEYASNNGALGKFYPFFSASKNVIGLGYFLRHHYTFRLCSFSIEMVNFEWGKNRRIRRTDLAKAFWFDLLSLMSSWWIWWWDIQGWRKWVSMTSPSLHYQNEGTEEIQSRLPLKEKIWIHGKIRE